MKRPLKIGPDGLVEFATTREIKHLTHCLERQQDTPASQNPRNIDSVDFPLPVRSSTKSVECPQCDFRGTAFQFTRHFALSHARNEKRKRLPALLRSLKSREQMKVCPFCHSQIRKSKFQKHMNDRCPMRNRPTSSETVRQPAKPKQQVNGSNPSTVEFGTTSVRHKGEIEVERPSWWNNLDATKDCGYPAREEGRYGSYPSHDGFDDESKP